MSWVRAVRHLRNRLLALVKRLTGFDSPIIAFDDHITQIDADAEFDSGNQILECLDLEVRRTQVAAVRASMFS